MSSRLEKIKQIIQFIKEIRPKFRTINRMLLLKTNSDKIESYSSFTDNEIQEMYDICLEYLDNVIKGNEHSYVTDQQHLLMRKLHAKLGLHLNGGKSKKYTRPKRLNTKRYKKYLLK
jgi:hypothetical protein